VLAWAREAEARKSSVAELAWPPDRGVRVEWADMVWMVFREFVCLGADGLELTVAVIGYD
jgi:hypothetical protein